MKAPDIFIIIPATNGRSYYIKPYDISYLEESPFDGVQVWFKKGQEVVYLETLLTAQEIHERIIELEAQSIPFTFGEDNASD